MPRKSKAPAKKGRSASSPPPSRHASLLRTWWLRVRAVAIGLALIGLVSALPDALVQRLPESARQVVAIAVSIRDLVGDIAQGTSDLISGLTGPDQPAPAKRTTRQTEPERGPPLADTGDRGPPLDLPHVPSSFSAAKKVLYEEIYADHRETFYCRCRYNAEGRIKLRSCGMSGIKDPRAKRVEAEHVFPAAWFGNTRKCWREPAAFPSCVSRKGNVVSGRECCERTDPVFATAHNDLFNLFPANGYVNGQRSDYRWGMVDGGERFGDCEIRIDASQRLAQPPPTVRGDIARTMFYMRDVYRFRLSRQDEQLFIAWNNVDPPDSWEIERDRRIKRIQGRGNRYVEDYRRL